MRHLTMAQCEALDHEDAMRRHREREEAERPSDLSEAALTYIDGQIRGVMDAQRQHFEAELKTLVEQHNADLNAVTEAINKAAVSPPAQIDQKRLLVLQFAMNFTANTKVEPEPECVMEAARLFYGFLQGDC